MPPHEQPPTPDIGFWAQLFRLHVSPQQWVISGRLRWRASLGPLLLLVMGCHIIHGWLEYRDIARDVRQVTAQWATTGQSLKLDEGGFELEGGGHFVHDAGLFAVLIDPAGEVPLKTLAARDYYVVRGDRVEMRVFARNTAPVEAGEILQLLEGSRLDRGDHVAIDAEGFASVFASWGPGLVIGVTLIRDGLGDALSWVLCAFLAASFWGPGRGRQLGLDTRETIKISLAICVPMVVCYTSISIAADHLGLIGAMLRVGIITALALYALPRPKEEP